MTRLNIAQVFGILFAKRHAMLFKIAKANGLALCGGTAVALVRGDKSYLPTDLDFVCPNDGGVENTVAELSSFLSSRQNHWVIQCNSHNNFCHGFAKMHARITCKLWLPICIFGIDADKFKSHMWKGNVSIQDLNSIKSNAAAFTKADGKPRYASKFKFADVTDAPTAQEKGQLETPGHPEEVATKHVFDWNKFKEELTDLQLDAQLDPPYKPKETEAPF